MRPFSTLSVFLGTVMATLPNVFIRGNAALSFAAGFSRQHRGARFGPTLVPVLLQEG